MVEDFVDGLAVKTEPMIVLGWGAGYREERESVLSRPPSKPTLFIEAKDRPGISVKLTYWNPDSGIRNFVWIGEKSFLSLHGRALTNFAIITCACAGLRFLIVFGYRTRRRRRYEAYQQRLTQRRFAEKDQFEKARQLATGNEVAKALVLLNELLESNPNYAEAKELKHLITMSDQAGIGSIVQTHVQKTHGGPGTEPGIMLYLKVFGTPYAYRAEPGAERITLGRQRRKVEGTRELGNDLVVRVPASDRASLRISRRHLEIRRIDREFFVTDKSGGNTKLNGRPLSPNKPAAIRSGDRLIIANVVTLEITIRPGPAAHRQGALCLDGPLRTDAGIMMEATLGDMVTEVPHE
jgi:hypothetical protein